MESADSLSFNKSNIKTDALPKIVHDINLREFIEINNTNFKTSLFLNKKNPIENLDMIYKTYAQ